MKDFKKEEILKRCQSGNIPKICDLIKKGYLDNLNEEINLIFLDVNPKLKYHLENTIKKKEKKKIDESVYILLKLMELGDQVARKVFKEEIVKLCQSGFIPMIWDFFKEGYLDILNEEINLIFLEVNPKLKHHLENTRKKEMINKSDYILLKLKESGDQIAEEIIKKKVKEINLSDSNLTELPVWLGQLTSLQTLYLWGNQLKELPAWLGQLTSLQTLNLGGNQLTELPTTFGQLTALQTLNLGSNRLTKLPTTFGQLASLQTLNLGNNQLKALPTTFGQLTALQTLDLGFNQFTKLPTTFGQLTALQTLNLEKNQLTELPTTFGQLTALQTLDLGFNKLTELPATFGQLTAIQTLYLDDNQLTELPASLEQLKILEILTLVDNDLTEHLDSKMRSLIEKLEQKGVTVILYG